jgi:hypothetical protein
MGLILTTVGDVPTYITIKRDSTDLGNPDLSGLATAQNNAVNVDVLVPVGITFTDKPGDTNSHTYQPYLRAYSSSTTAEFPYDCVAYLLVEEIRQ